MFDEELENANGGGMFAMAIVVMIPMLSLAIMATSGEPHSLVSWVSAWLQVVIALAAAPAVYNYVESQLCIYYFRRSRGR